MSDKKFDNFLEKVQSRNNMQNDIWTDIIDMWDSDRTAQESHYTEIERAMKEMNEKLEIIIKFCNDAPTIKTLQDDNNRLTEELLGEKSAHQETKNELETLERRYSDLESAKNNLERVYDGNLRELKETHQNECERLERERDEERKKKETSAGEIIKLKSSIEGLTTEKSNLRVQIENLQTGYDEVVAQNKEQMETERGKVSDLQSEADNLRHNLGSLFQKYSDLYCRFKESDCVTDTAMRQLYGENYSIFFARCGSESIVEGFHKALSSVIFRVDESFIRLADELLDFCAEACTQINGVQYSRMDTKEQDDFQSMHHISRSRGSGKKISRVLLRGIIKEGQPEMRSYVEVEKEGE